MPLANRRLGSLSVDSRDVSRAKEGVARCILGDIVAVRSALRIFERLGKQGLVTSGTSLDHEGTR